MKRLQGKVAIVTGSSRGIGAAIARKFAQEGAAVTVNYVNDKTAAQKLVEGIKREGGNALAIKCDVSNFKEVEEMVTSTINHFHRLDILVNNAGILLGGFVEEANIEDWKRVMEVIFLGTLYCSKVAIPYLKKQGGGRIINCSSISGRLPDVEQCAYAASKAAIDNFTRSLAGELGPYNITVNAYAPGLAKTDMTKGILSNEPIANLLLNRIPLRRFGEPEDIANLCVFLASDEASYITGAVIPVDGGMLCVQAAWRAKEFIDKKRPPGWVE